MAGDFAARIREAVGGESGGSRAGFSTTENEKQQAAVLAELMKLGGSQLHEEGVRYEGTEAVVPLQYKGDLRGYIRYLEDLEEGLQVKTAFMKKFNFRPFDVANALQLALSDIFGAAGVGKETIGMFGMKIPPRRITIDVGYGQSREVPWGELNLAPLSAQIEMGSTNDPNLGLVGIIKVEAPKKNAAAVQGLFKAVEMKLRSHSIYRGKAIDGSQEPGFLDTSKVDPSKVVYSTEVMAQLESSVWAVMDYADTLRAANVSLSRKVLLEGPYGTGKSLAATLTAVRAVANNWTFIFVRPGVDNLRLAMQTARVYAPAVVFVEDIDTAGSDDDKKMSELLDIFDGVEAKNRDIIGIFSTNHVDNLHPGMLRPGRLDQLIHIDGLDAAALEKLIRALTGDKLHKDFDLVQVAEAMAGYTPAFIVEAVGRALRDNVVLGAGKFTQITTADLVHAGKGIRWQYDLMVKATDGHKKPVTLDDTVQTAVQKALHGVSLIDLDGDPDGWIVTEEHLRPAYGDRRDPRPLP